MKVEQQIWHLKPKKGFKDIQISWEDKGYKIFYQSKDQVGCVEFKNLVCGFWGYVSNREEVNKIAEFYATYEECIEVIKKQTPVKLHEILDKGIAKRFLIGFKNAQ